MQQDEGEINHTANIFLLRVDQARQLEVWQQFGLYTVAHRLILWLVAGAGKQPAWVNP